MEKHLTAPERAAIQCRQAQKDEIARLRADLERVTDERDEALAQASQDRTQWEARVEDLTRLGEEVARLRADLERMTAEFAEEHTAVVAWRLTAADRQTDLDAALAQATAATLLAATRGRALEGLVPHLTYEAQLPDGGDDANGCESTSPMWFCLVCSGDDGEDAGDGGEASIDHTPDCPVPAARALLAAGE